VFDDNRAFDHKKKTLYNAILYLAVDAGLRDPKKPYGSLSDLELLYTWVHTKNRGDIPPGDSVPIRAMNAAAVEMGVCEWSDLIEKEIDPANDDPFTLSEALTDEDYNETVELFEDEYGVSPGRSKFISEESVKVENVSTDRSVKVFAEMCLRTDVGEDDLIKDEYETPRVTVDKVWKVYEEWCRINDIDSEGKFSGAKSEIAEELGIEKTAARYPGVDGTAQCYMNTKFSSLGYWVEDRLE
jgi:hypothetical protein